MGETFKKENEEKNSPKLTKEEYIKALEEKTAQIAQAKKSGNLSITETAVLYHDRGSLYMSIEDLDNAINDYQTAVTLTENEPDDDTRNYFRNALRRGCEEKQRTQTIDERMAPYAELIKEIKSRQMQPVYQITKYELREEYVELAAALAFFEEYELLKRYIKEGAGSINNTFNFNILNYNVRPQFAYWEPAPLYFITGKKAWNKMKDPKKMLEYLVKKGANIDEKAGDGSTPLLNLTFFDSSPEILDTLLELGANPDKTSIDNDIIWTPLTHCLMMKYEEEDANLPFDDEAIKKASLLLEYGADPNLASPDFSDFPPLVMALRFGFHTQDGPSRGKIACGIYDFIELLIKRGANINFKDSNGNTPLSIAQKNNLSAAVKLLLKNGALTPQQMDEQEENSTEKTAKNYFNEASGALKMKDYDKAVTLFFKAANTDFGNKEYHKAFANALLKRGLKPLQEKDKIKAEELYQKAVKARSLYSQEMWLQAALLGHLESAYELRNRFVIAVMTSPEGKALSDLLVKADHPQTLCKAAYNYSCGMGGYPRNKNKAMKLFQRAADLGYKPAADTIEQIKRSEKEEKERIIAEREFAKNNPPLKGKKREKLEEE
ncbi:MAG: hypothetical protein LBH16_09025 [Treponema sp.]|jgi:ankyrin repeat protein|nr:hypothetical protein [Treponema sp.]